MDFKSLMAKLEAIDKKQVLAESTEAVQTVEDTEQTVLVESANPVMRSSIARTLVREFGYEDLAEADPAQEPGMISKLGSFLDKNAADVAKKQAADAQAKKDMADPAAQEKIKATLSPEQLKWLGGANPADPIIMARLKAAVPDKPAAAAAPAGGQGASPAPAAKPTGTTAQGDDEGNTTITKPDGTTMVVGPDGNAIKPGTNPNLPTNKAQAAALASGAQDDATGVDAAVAAQQAAGPGKAPATQAASPAKKPAGTPDPKVLALQQELIKKGAKIKADGIMGPATQAAQKQFGGGQAASPANPATGVNAQGQNVTIKNADGSTTNPETGVTTPAPKAGQAASPAATGASAVPASADKTKPYWVGGTRYEFKSGRGGGSWQATATPSDKLQWNATRARSSSGFTGADDQYGKTPQNASTEFNDPAIQEELQAMLRIAGLR